MPGALFALYVLNKTSLCKQMADIAVYTDSDMSHERLRRVGVRSPRTALTVTYDEEEPSFLTLTLEAPFATRDEVILEFTSASHTDFEVVFMSDSKPATLCRTAVCTLPSNGTLRLWLRCHHLMTVVVNAKQADSTVAQCHLDPCRLAVCEPDPPPEIATHCSCMLTSALLSVEADRQEELLASRGALLRKIANAASWLLGWRSRKTVQERYELPVAVYKHMKLKPGDAESYLNKDSAWKAGRTAKWAGRNVDFQLVDNLDSASQGIVYSNSDYVERNVPQRTQSYTDAINTFIQDPLSFVLDASNSTGISTLGSDVRDVSSTERSFFTAQHVARIMTIACTRPALWHSLRKLILERYRGLELDHVKWLSKNHLCTSLDQNASRTQAREDYMTLEDVLQSWSPRENGAFACLYLYDFIGLQSDLRATKFARIGIVAPLALTTLKQTASALAQARGATKIEVTQMQTSEVQLETMEGELTLDMCIMQCAPMFSRQFRVAAERFAARGSKCRSIARAVNDLNESLRTEADVRELNAQRERTESAVETNAAVYAAAVACIDAMKRCKENDIPLLQKKLDVVNRLVPDTELAASATKYTTILRNFRTGVDAILSFMDAHSADFTVVMKGGDDVTSLEHLEMEADEATGKLQKLSRDDGLAKLVMAVKALQVDTQVILDINEIVKQVKIVARQGEKRVLSCPASHPIWAPSSRFGNILGYTPMYYATKSIQTTSKPPYHEWQFRNSELPAPNISGRCVAAFPWTVESAQQVWYNKYTKKGTLRSDPQQKVLEKSPSLPSLTDGDLKGLGGVENLTVPCGYESNTAVRFKNKYFENFANDKKYPEFEAQECGVSIGLTPKQMTEVDAADAPVTIDAFDTLSFIIDDRDEGANATNDAIDTAIQALTPLPDETSTATVCPYPSEAPVVVATPVSSTPIRTARDRIRDSGILHSKTAKEAASILYSATAVWQRSQCGLEPFLTSAAAAGRLQQIAQDPEIVARLKELRLPVEDCMKLHGVYAESQDESSAALNGSQNSAAGNVNQVNFYRHKGSDGKIVPCTDMGTRPSPGKRTAIVPGPTTDPNLTAKGFFKQFRISDDASAARARMEIVLSVAAELLGIGPQLLAVAVPIEGEDSRTPFGKDGANYFWFMQCRALTRNVCNNEFYAAVRRTGHRMDFSAPEDLDRAYRDVFVLVYSMLALGFIHGDEKCGNIVIAKKDPITLRMIDFGEDFIKAVDFTVRPEVLTARVAASAACFMLPSAKPSVLRISTTIKRIESLDAGYNQDSKMHGSVKVQLGGAGNLSASSDIATVFPPAPSIGSLAPFFPLAIVSDLSWYDPVKYQELLRDARENENDVGMIMDSTRSAQVFVAAYRYVVEHPNSDTAKAFRLAAETYWGTTMAPAALQCKSTA